MEISDSFDEINLNVVEPRREIDNAVVNAPNPSDFELNVKYNQRKNCCPDNSFAKRLWDRLKLEHLTLDNAPGFVLIKSIVLCILVLLIDKGTQNPDSVSAVFVGLIGLSPFLQGGKAKTTNILVCGLLGATIGSLISAACYLPPTEDPNRWMLILTVPWSVALTQYILFFVGFDDDNSKSTGQFSALFVVLVQYEYSPLGPILPDSPRIIIWQTLIVRILALLTAVVCSFLINLIVSASVPMSIYKAQQYITERAVWDATLRRRIPTDTAIQKCFSKVLKQIELGPVVNKAAELWIFGDETRNLGNVIENRAKAMFRYLTFRSFVELYIESIESNQEERDLLLDVMEKSKRDKFGNSLSGLTLEEEVKIFELLPDNLYVIKTIFIDILYDLDNSRIPYKSPEKVNLFLGLT